MITRTITTTTTKTTATNAQGMEMTTTSMRKAANGCVLVMSAVSMNTEVMRMSDDMISRKATIDAMAKFVPYAIDDDVTRAYTDGLTDAYNLVCQLPSAQPVAKDINVLNNDCISRQAAIDAVENIDCSDGVGISALKCEAVDDGVTAIKALPSAQPEVLACGEGELIAQPKIIRCKECVYADENYHCDYMTTWNDGDCFCCYGKRRNDEQ